MSVEDIDNIEKLVRRPEDAKREYNIERVLTVKLLAIIAKQNKEIILLLKNLVNK